MTQFSDEHHHHQQPKRDRDLHGPRPSPLRIHRDSHTIHKPHSSSSSLSLPPGASLTAKYQNPPAPRHPVIIYTHSPKIIHTQARDFMALVQKLTGLHRSDHPTSSPLPCAKQPIIDGGNPNNSKDDMGSSSAVSEENSRDFQVNSLSKAFDPSATPFFSDIPLFTPNSSEFFCSPRSFLRFPDPVFSPANMGNSVSPAFLEAMKGFTEY